MTAPQSDAPIEKVQLDALTLFKVIKHCRESLPSLVTGQLLGMDTETGVLEVTNCFPFPSTGGTGSDGAPGSDGAEYQINMMRCLREVNIDHSTVGWYQSTYMGSFVNQSLIETQFNYQQNISQSIVLIYDPLQSAHGTTALKAYRLADSFMDWYKEKKFTTESIQLAALTYKDILQEVPIVVHNSGLVSAFLYELEEKVPMTNYDCLNIVPDPILEKNLELLSDCLDDFSQDQYRWNKYQQHVQRQQQQIHYHQNQRKIENQHRIARGQAPLPEEDLSLQFKTSQEPSRLELLLLQNQMSQYCKQMNQFSSTSFCKLFSCSDLQKL